MRAFVVVALGISVLTVSCGSDSSPKKQQGAAACKAFTDCGAGTTCFAGQCVPTTSTPDGGQQTGGGGADTSGAGGASTGGVDVGGAPAGNGGTPGDGGLQPGTGGSAPIGDAAPPAVRPTSTGVYCGEKACPVGQNCCFMPGTQGFPGQPATPGTYSCSSGACAGTESEAACDGPEDCTGGQLCCRVVSGGSPAGGGRTTYACRDSCPAGGTEIGCAGPQNCTGAQICCETVTQNVPTKTACADGCGATGEYAICLQDADCPSGGMCNPSTLLSGMKRCF